MYLNHQIFEGNCSYVFKILKREKNVFSKALHSLPHLFKKHSANFQQFTVARKQPSKKATNAESGSLWVKKSAVNLLFYQGQDTIQKEFVQFVPVFIYLQ